MLLHFFKCSLVGQFWNSLGDKNCLSSENFLTNIFGLLRLLDCFWLVWGVWSIHTCFLAAIQGKVISGDQDERGSFVIFRIRRNGGKESLQISFTVKYIFQIRTIFFFQGNSGVCTSIIFYFLISSSLRHTNCTIIFDFLSVANCPYRPLH